MDCEPEQQFTASLDVCSAGMHVVVDDDDGESLLFCLVHPLVAWYVVGIVGDFDGVNDKEGIAEEEGVRVVGLFVPGGFG